MRIGAVLLLVVLHELGCVLPVAAHRLFAAKFADKHPVKLEGAVAEFDFTNPHS